MDGRLDQMLAQLDTVKPAAEVGRARGISRGSLQEVEQQGSRMTRPISGHSETYPSMDAQDSE